MRLGVALAAALVPLGCHVIRNDGKVDAITTGGLLQLYCAHRHQHVAPVVMYRGVQPQPVPCPLGMFRQPGNGLSLTECQLCPRGVYGKRPGLESSACSGPCPKGTYQDRLGATSIDDCTPCPKGTYGATPGLTTRACTAPCPYGTYSMTEGLTAASSCVPCEPDYRGPNGHRGNNVNFANAGGYVCDRYFTDVTRKKIATGKDAARKKQRLAQYE